MSHRKRVWYGGNALLLTLFVLAILIVLEAFSARHHKRIDLTENSRYSLSEQSVKVLEALDADVEVLAFYRDDENRPPVRELLEQYAYISPRFTYRLVDPDRRPALANRYDVTMYGTIVLDRGDRSERVSSPAGPPSEQELTNALLKLSRDSSKKVLFLTGHGERGIQDLEPAGFGRAREKIEQANYETEELLLMRSQGVPEDCNVLVIVGPEKPLFPAEIEPIRAYLDRGGKLLVLLDPSSDEGYGRLLGEYGFQVGQDIIVDQMSRMFGADYTMPVVMEYGTHPIVERFSLATFFSLARSVRPAASPPAGIRVEALASSGASSWGETDLETLMERQEAEYDEAADLGGPVPLAAVAQVERAGGEPDDPEAPPAARIVVVGDSDFADNTHLDVSGNSDLLLNIISWLAEEEDLISIRPREMGSSPLLLTPTQSWIAFLVPVVLVPGLVIALGLMVLIRRRRSA